MKPLILKEPAACCGTATLLWMGAKHYFQCPCGKMKADLDGRLCQDKKRFVNYCYGNKTYETR